MFKFLKKKKISTFVSVEIFFRDGTSKRYHVSMPEESNATYLRVFYGFYKWFFFRKHSNVYCFEYKNGGDVFYREDIKSISFLNIKKEERGLDKK